MTDHGGVAASSAAARSFSARSPSSTRDHFDGLAFCGSPLDRVSERREDEAVLEALRARRDGLCVIIGKEQVATVGVASSGAPASARNAVFAAWEAERFGPSRESVLLGLRPDGAPIWAVQLDDSAVTAEGEKDPTVSWDFRTLRLQARPDVALRDLRSMAVNGDLDAPSLAILAQAKAVLAWHARHRFCSNCGAPTRLAAAGWRRDCPACAAQHFPRTDPVVIMLAVHGEGEDARCLLGRQPRFPKSMYSALAGFVEAGETLEEAARRELREEAGVEVGAVRYLGSQPWPFPMNLMIGCLARARSDALKLDRVELEDARWFTREQVAAMDRGEHEEGLWLPQPVAIARRLIQAWREGEEP
jgi:NAD+ diphosphatase